MAVGRMAPTSALGGVSPSPCPLQWLPCVFAIAEDTFVSVTLTPRVCRVLATLVRTAIFTPFGSRVPLRNHEPITNSIIYSPIGYRFMVNQMDA